MTIAEVHDLPRQRTSEELVRDGWRLMDDAFRNGRVLGRKALGKALGRSETWAYTNVTVPYRKALEEAARAAVTSGQTPVVDQSDTVATPVQQASRPRLSAAFDVSLTWYLMGVTFVVCYLHALEFVHAANVQGPLAYFLAPTADLLALAAYRHRHVPLFAAALCVSLFVNWEVTRGTWRATALALFVPAVFAAVHYLKDREID